MNMNNKYVRIVLLMLRVENILPGSTVRLL